MIRPEQTAQTPLHSKPQSQQPKPATAQAGPSIGHNNGPAMDRGVAYRRHVWTKARAQLLPVLPLPVVRMRVRRAAEIGLDYKTYATVRATSGRDVVALLFSTNALRLFRAHQLLDADRAAKLARITATDRRAIAVAPLLPEQVRVQVLDAVQAAPNVHAPWPESARQIAAARGPHPADGVLLIGDTAFERDWSMAGRLAGYLPADRFF